MTPSNSVKSSSPLFDIKYDNALDAFSRFGPNFVAKNINWPTLDA